MITIINCKNKNYLFKLRAILESRRSRNKTNTNIVLKIINDETCGEPEQYFINL